MAWMQDRAPILPKVWPPELPPENQSATEQFWREACRLEMLHRDSLNEKIRSMIDDPLQTTLSPMESWLLWRRFEWAGQVFLAKASENIAPPDTVTLQEVLEWALIKTWETDGCIGMWNHSERGGVPHPDNPNGLSPLSRAN